MPPTFPVGLEVRIMLRAIPTRFLVLMMMAALAAPLVGCHADANDPEDRARRSRWWGPTARARPRW